MKTRTLLNKARRLHREMIISLDLTKQTMGSISHLNEYTAECDAFRRANKRINSVFRSLAYIRGRKK